jgi:hypothetical protein
MRFHVHWAKNERRPLMQLIVQPSGQITCIYTELIDLSSLGQLTITRGSHLEPDADGKWLADLSPVGGPVLGPFERRSEALAAEQAWLEEHWLREKKGQ